jgi:hypothetical protein
MRKGARAVFRGRDGGGGRHQNVDLGEDGLELVDGKALDLCVVRE